MCFTDDNTLHSIMQSLKNHGQGNHKYDNARIGINGRLDTLQAAVLLAKVEIFSEEIELRQQVAKYYYELLSKKTNLVLPQIPDGLLSAWAQYSILATDEEHRASLQGTLKEAGIPTAIYYPKPLHLQTAFSSLGYGEGSFPVCEDFASRIFSLPMHPYLTREQQEQIVAAF